MAASLRASIDMLLSSEFWRMAIRWTLSLLYSRLLLLFRPSTSFPRRRRRRRFSPDPDSRIERPICVVTGATSGLGAAAARALAGEGFHVVLVSDIEVDRENLSCLPTSGKYRCAHIYEYSKMCSLLFTYELHRQFYAKDLSADISVNAADPGAVETNIMRELPGCLSQLAFTVLRLLCLLQSPEEGVASVVDAALAPEEVSGRYFFGGKGRTIRSSLLSYDARLAADLWSTSHMLLQESLRSQGG